jgi:hypothetical protein
LEPERIRKELLDYTPRAKRSNERSKSRWKDQHMLEKKGTDPKIQTLMMMMMMTIHTDYKKED